MHEGRDQLDIGEREHRHRNETLREGERLRPRPYGPEASSTNRQRRHENDEGSEEQAEDDHGRARANFADR
ncbi:MAG TPA: hypothetical protein VF316_17435 [Polyangiaceae bacterium]